MENHCLHWFFAAFLLVYNPMYPHAFVVDISQFILRTCVYTLLTSFQFEGRKLLKSELAMKFKESQKSFHIQLYKEQYFSYVACCWRTTHEEISLVIIILWCTLHISLSQILTANCLCLSGGSESGLETCSAVLEIANSNDILKQHNVTCDGLSLENLKIKLCFVVQKLCAHFLVFFLPSNFEFFWTCRLSYDRHCDSDKLQNAVSADCTCG